MQRQPTAQSSSVLATDAARAPLPSGEGANYTEQVRETRTGTRERENRRKALDGSRGLAIPGERPGSVISPTFGPAFPMPDQYIAAVLESRGEHIIRKTVQKLRKRAERKLRAALGPYGRDLEAA